MGVCVYVHRIPYIKHVDIVPPAFLPACLPAHRPTRTQPQQTTNHLQLLALSNTCILFVLMVVFCVHFMSFPRYERICGLFLIAHPTCRLHATGRLLRASYRYVVGRQYASSPGRQLSTLLRGRHSNAMMRYWYGS